MTTVAPSLAYPRAMAAPMPRLEPVTTQILFFSLMLFSYSLISFAQMPVERLPRLHKVLLAADAERVGEYQLPRARGHRDGVRAAVDRGGEMGRIAYACGQKLGRTAKRVDGVAHLLYKRNAVKPEVLYPSDNKAHKIRIEFQKRYRLRGLKGKRDIEFDAAALKFARRKISLRERRQFYDDIGRKR